MENDIRDRIIKKGEEMFLQFGFHRVTMEELASELGISKKTLYKYYTGKEQLLKEIIDSMKCTIDDYTNEVIADPTTDFIQKLKMIMTFVGQNMNKMRGPLLADLQKNHPELYNEITRHRKEAIITKFSKLATAGIKSGHFRKDIDKQLVVLIYMNVISGIMNPDVLSELALTSDQVFESISKVVFEGVLTEEGRQKYHSTKTAIIKN